VAAGRTGLTLSCRAGWCCRSERPAVLCSPLSSGVCRMGPLRHPLPEESSCLGARDAGASRSGVRGLGGVWGPCAPYAVHVSLLRISSCCLSFLKLASLSLESRRPLRCSPLSGWHVPPAWEQPAPGALNIVCGGTPSWWAAVAEAGGTTAGAG